MALTELQSKFFEEDRSSHGIIRYLQLFALKNISHEDKIIPRNLVLRIVIHNNTINSNFVRDLSVESFAGITELFRNCSISAAIRIN